MDPWKTLGATHLSSRLREHRMINVQLSKKAFSPLIAALLLVHPAHHYAAQYKDYNWLARSLVRTGSNSSTLLKKLGQKDFLDDSDAKACGLATRR